MNPTESAISAPPQARRRRRKKKPYVPGAMERFGRRLKMEYVGMGSVFVVIGGGIFGDLTAWSELLTAAVATGFLFLALKRKVLNHLVASFLMYAAAILAQGAVFAASWAPPFLGFCFCAWAAEGQLEDRRNRAYWLPPAFALWAGVDPSWILGLAYLALYLTQPFPEQPRLRRRWLVIVVLSALAAVASLLVRGDAAALQVGDRLRLDGPQIGLFLLVAIPTLASLIRYRAQLAPPRRWNALLFGLLAPWDVRLLAAFGIPATIALAATVFRKSADSRRIRFFLKHAEWTYHWLVFFAAVWILVRFAPRFGLG